VEITPDRDKNFAEADKKLAESRRCSLDEIKQMRKDEKLTWHECEDMKTMQLVPRDVHGNTPHSGGVSIAKAEANGYNPNQQGVT
jgi:hypothetical protein